MLTSIKRLALFGVVCALLLGGGRNLARQYSRSAAAQSSQYSAMLLNMDARTLIRVYADGTQETYELGVDEQTYLASSELSFSADGNRVAFAATRPPASDGEGGGAKFVVRDLPSGTNFFEIAVPIEIPFNVSPNAMSADGRTVAYGVANLLPGEFVPDPNAPAWELFLLDVETGDLLQELSANAPIFEGVDSPLGDLPVQPYVQNLTEEAVIFALIPALGMGFDMSTLPAYRWDRATDEVSAAPGWWNAFPDVLPNGTAVWAAFDENRPAGVPAGPAPSYNIVTVRNPDGGEQVIYASGAEWIIQRVKFIDSGREVAINLVESFNQDQGFEAIQTRWIAIDRAGQQRELHVAPNAYNDMFNAPDGYLYVYSDWENRDMPDTYVEYYQNDEGTLLWYGERQTAYLTWAAPVSPPEGLAPFTAIQ